LAQAVRRSGSPCCVLSTLCNFGDMARAWCMAVAFVLAAVVVQADNWEQVALKHCGNHLLGSGYSTVTGHGYSTMNEANDACLLNAQCNGVWDERCDGSGSFYICDKAHEWEASSPSVGSCVYRRPETTTTTSEPVRRLAASTAVDNIVVVV